MGSSSSILEPLICDICLELRSPIIGHATLDQIPSTSFLPCFHSFHSHCLSKAIIVFGKCPTCSRSFGVCDINRELLCLCDDINQATTLWFIDPFHFDAWWKFGDISSCPSRMIFLKQVFYIHGLLIPKVEIEKHSNLGVTILCEKIVKVSPEWDKVKLNLKRIPNFSEMRDHVEDILHFFDDDEKSIVNLVMG